MAHVITFRTSKFDAAAETPNPINPIAGQSVLRWLSDHLKKSDYETTAPDAEDWGWYMDVSGGSGAYLVGASGDPHQPAGDVEWTVQVHKHRSFIDRLTRANKMEAADPLAALIERIVRADPDIKDVECEREGDTHRA